MTDISQFWNSAQRVVIDGEAQLLTGIDGDISLSQCVDGDSNIVVDVGEKTDIYDGDYVFTPSNDEQIIECQDMAMQQNVIINPIPSNYGLITWNGATLTVS